jgi:DedD protein
MAGNRPARERFDFSLDARQVAGVTLGALGTLAVAFLLGLWLGQRSPDRLAPAAARTAPAQSAPAIKLEDLDKPPRPDGGEPAVRDTFHETLTSPKPPADNLPPVPKATPIPAPAPASAPSASVSTPVAAATGPSGASGPGAAPRAAPAAEPQPAATAAASPAAKPAVPPAKAAAPPAKGATAKGTPPKPAPAKAAAPASAKGAPAKGAFSVQVGSTQDRSEADKIAARFASRGARVTVADVPGKGRWYRVRLGAFETREAADRYLKDLERSTGARGFVAAAN